MRILYAVFHRTGLNIIKSNLLIKENLTSCFFSHNYNNLFTPYLIKDGLLLHHLCASGIHL